MQPKRIIDNRPERMGLYFALRARETVRVLIRQDYGISMPIRTVGLYLLRRRGTPQKPVEFTYERNPSKAKVWLEEAFPGDQAKSKAGEGWIPLER